MASSLSVGTEPTNLVDVPVQPTAINYGLQDISAADAGRVQDADNTMYKDRVSQKRKLQLTWTNPTLAQASAIMQMFNPEYIFVRYVDILSGGYQTREFYVGDRSAPFKHIEAVDASGNRTIVSTLSFDIIEM